MSRTLTEQLETSVRKHTDRVALVDAVAGRTLSYGVLAQRLRDVQGLLAAHDVSPGDVIVLVGGNSIEMAVALLGVMAYGAIANPLNPALSSSEVEALVSHSGARLLLAEPTWNAPPRLSVQRLSLSVPEATLPANPPPPPPGQEDGALLIYTSGTTGKPKGILLSHRNIVTNVMAAAQWLSIGPEHRSLVLLPLFHTFALISDLCTPLFRGGCAVVAPAFDVSRIRTLQEILHRERIRSFSAVPLMFDLMTRLEVAFPETLQFCVSGAAPLRPETVSTYLSRHGIKIIPAYGMTETTCFCTISPPDAVVPASCGVPVGCEVRVIDDHGRNVTDRTVGELIVRGPSVLAGGYFRDERPCYLEADDGRWLPTGDLAYRDQQGYVFIVGRKKNMVIRGGEKVYLEDLDKALAALSGVMDCASVGVSREHVDRIVTFVVPETSATLDRTSVLAHLRERVGDAKCPDVVAFVGAIPRTATNKVRVGELQEAARGYL